MEFVPDAAFEVNDPTVISETIDGETVIINLTSGSYYSLKHSAAAIWSGIQQTARLSDIATMVRSNFLANGAGVEGEIAALIARLSEEGLVRPAEAAIALDGGPATAEPAVRPYATPVLEKFTDMEAMLLLDPVHDVDDEGWPHIPKPDGPIDA
jgi:hypothetical protein